MDEFSSVDEILDFAIARELAANRFYLLIASQMENPAMREVFEDFAKEELGHKAKLENMKKLESVAPSENVADLKIADYVVAKEPGPEMDYQDALILAMQEEKAAFKLYSKLAAMTDDASVRNTFLALAQEEAKHKLRFEIEYDDVILKDN